MNLSDANKSCEDNVIMPSHANKSCNQSCTDNVTVLRSVKNPKKMKVSFANDGNPVKIHYMVTWPYAYNQSRKGGWEVVVADRHRFQRRIQQSESFMEKVLQEHHKKILEKEREDHLTRYDK